MKTGTRCLSSCQPIDVNMDFPKSSGTEQSHSPFLKALPNLPQFSTLPARGEQSRAISSLSILLHSPLPPLPKEKASTMAIPRRPVGGANLQTKISSIHSVSSIYSISPGFSRSPLNDSQTTKGSLSEVDSEDSSIPPVPPKHARRQQLPKSPTSFLASSVSNLLQSSTTRRELWRRRSLKKDKGISVSDLNLTQSNGSTANPRRVAPTERHLPAVPTQIPQSISSRKPLPIPARPAPSQFGLMGTKLSKLKGKEKRVSKSSSQAVPPTPQPHPSMKRLPTPEYQKTDKSPKLIPQVISPASPTTPPTEDPPHFPLNSPSRGAVKDGPLNNTTNLPKPFSTRSHSGQLDATLTVDTGHSLMRSPQPHKTFEAQILDTNPTPSISSEIPPVRLPAQVVPLIKFPTLQSVAPAGTVFPAPPLDIVHYECYQSHKFMRSSGNTTCPIACMICQRQDTGKRWRCTWCCMAACGSCMEVLVTLPGRDLKTCVDRIGTQH